MLIRDWAILIASAREMTRFFFGRFACALGRNENAVTTLSAPMKIRREVSPDRDLGERAFISITGTGPEKS
jgi:hypothetical protein